ncbi:MAG: extracellular solute-binding protein [Gemmatimonadota bacterium]|nr:extracellular solute-binding protein [Gemmatimonadota bacterium]
MKTRKSWVVLALAYGAALVVGVASGSAASAESARSTAPSAANEEVTLRALFASINQPAQEILNKNFERVYPNIKIQAQYLSSDALATLLVTQLQAGNAPDVFSTVPGRSSPGSVWSLAEAHRLLNLSNRAWEKRIYPAGLPFVSWNKSVFAWPLTVTPYGVIYNQDLFRQLGLRVPATFSQVISMCRKISAAGKVPFVQAFGNPVASIIIGRQRAAQYVFSVDPQWTAKRRKGQVTFAGSPQWRRALDSIADMNREGCFQRGAAGTSRPQQYASLARGEAVMSIMSGAELASVQQLNPNLKLAMFNLPADKAANSAVFAAATLNISGNAATRHAGHVRTFIDFMAREKQSSLFSRVSGAIAPLDLKKGIIPAYMKSGLGPFFAKKKIVGSVDYGWPNSSVWSQGAVPGITGLITGQTTVDEVLGNMDRLWAAGR